MTRLLLVALVLLSVPRVRSAFSRYVRQPPGQMPLYICEGM